MPFFEKFMRIEFFASYNNLCFLFSFFTRFLFTIIAFLFSIRKKICLTRKHKSEKVYGSALRLKQTEKCYIFYGKFSAVFPTRWRRKNNKIVYVDNFS